MLGSRRLSRCTSRWISPALLGEIGSVPQIDREFRVRRFAGVRICTSRRNRKRVVLPIEHEIPALLVFASFTTRPVGTSHPELVIDTSRRIGRVVEERAVRTDRLPATAATGDEDKTVALAGIASPNTHGAPPSVARKMSPGDSRTSHASFTCVGAWSTRGRAARDQDPPPASPSSVQPAARSEAPPSSGRVYVTSLR